MADAPAPSRRSWRGRLRGLAALVLAPYLLWLLLAHALLLTPLGQRLIRPRSDRWRVSWSWGWSLYPGDVHLRGFTYRFGRADGPGWSVGADRVAGRFRLWRLTDREVVFEGVRGRGVEVVRRFARSGAPAPSRPARPASARRGGWRVQLAGVELAGVRRIDQGMLAFVGDGSAGGSLDVSVGRSVRAVLDRVQLTGGRLSLGGQPLAADLAVEARGRLGPYSPRQHRGVAALDFLDGEVNLRGSSAPGGRDAIGEPRPGARRPLGGRVLIRGGRLEPGTDLRMDLPLALRGRTPERALGRELLAAPRLELLVAPGDSGGGDLPGGEAELELRIEAEGLDARLSGAALTTGPLHLLARTPERRLAQLLVRRPELGHLTADARVERPRLRGVRLGPLLADLTAETVSGRIDAAALLRRELRVASVEGQGIELALAPAGAPTESGRDGAPWSVAIDGGELDVRSVRLADLTAVGEGTLRVALALSPDGDLEVHGFDVSLTGARLLDGDETAAQAIDLELAAALRRTPLRAGPAEIVSSLAGRVSLRGEVERLDFLNRVMRARRWVRLDGAGVLDLVVSLSEGRLQPGSRVAVSRGRLEVAGLGYLATGSGEVSGGVAGEEARLSVRLSRLEARPEGARAAPAYVRGTGLDLELVSRDLDLLGAAESLRATLRVTGAEVPDATRFAPLIPEAAGLRLRGGSGTLDAELFADSAKDEARGRLRVDGRNVALAMPELELVGRTRLDLALGLKGLRSGLLRIDGSRLDLTELLWRETGDAASARGEGWWGRWSVPAGTLTWGHPLRLDAGVDFELRDSAPLVSLLARRRQLPGWVARAVTVRDVRGSSRVVLGSEGLRIEGLEARGGQLELLGRMSIAGQRRRGDLYVGLGPLGLGVALEDDRRDLRLLRPRAWYEALPPLR